MRSACRSREAFTSVCAAGAAEPGGQASGYEAALMEEGRSQRGVMLTQPPFAL
jgi:hypothetical protein